MGNTVGGQCAPACCDAQQLDVALEAPFRPAAGLYASQDEDASRETDCFGTGQVEGLDILKAEHRGHVRYDYEDEETPKTTKAEDKGSSPVRVGSSPTYRRGSQKGDWRKAAEITETTTIAGVKFAASQGRPPVARPPQPPPKDAMFDPMITRGDIG
mmetsp:Transcript_551/g.1100  ORF Transcript_551/g.1100 Transcript_551/m.1100 type:complete len:157 (+) Transcript_551:1-471(+)